MAGPLNYTTSIDPEKTAFECMSMLGRFGAGNVSIDYGRDRLPVAMEFTLTTRWGKRAYRLPADFAGTERALRRALDERRIERRYANPQQAARTAWRVIKDLLEANLAMLEAGLVTGEQAMLAWALVESGRTLFDVYDEQERKSIEGER